MIEREIDTILTILSAYPSDLVKTALKRRNAHLRGERIAAGWKVYTGIGEPPDEAGDRMQLGGLWYVRPRLVPPGPPQPSAADKAVAASDRAAAAGGRQSKSDLSMKPTDKICPLCGEVMAWEPICPGCALGRMGFKGRYVCMDDFDHTFYVTKPGLELPNS